MTKSNLTHTFHGGEVPILRSAIEGDRRDYLLMLDLTRRASEFSPVGRMRHDHRESVAVLRLQERLAGVRL